MEPNKIICPSNTYSKLHDLSQDKKKRSESFLIGPFKVAIYFKLRSRINRQECRSRPLNIRGDRLVAEVDCFISHGHLLQVPGICPSRKSNTSYTEKLSHSSISCALQFTLTINDRQLNIIRKQ